MRKEAKLKTAELFPFQCILTYCILVHSSTVLCWTCPFVLLGVSGQFCRFPVSDTVDPDRMPHFVASDRGLHCLPMTLLWVSRQERINGISASYNGEIKTILIIILNKNNNNNKYNIYYMHVTRMCLYSTENYHKHIWLFHLK